MTIINMFTVCMVSNTKQNKKHALSKDLNGNGIGIDV